MSYAIHIRQVAPQVVVTQRRHAALPELGRAMHSTLEKIATSVEPPTATRGAPFAVYYDEPFRPEDIDVELGMPVAGDARVTESAEVHRRELPGGPVAYTVHEGPYSAIGAAYEALYAWIAKHGQKRVGPPREIYVVGPGEETKPEDYRTEIEVPIE